MTVYTNAIPTWMRQPTIDAIVRDYSNMTLKEVAQANGTCPVIVRAVLTNQNIVIRPRGTTPPGYTITKTMTVDLTSDNNDTIVEPVETSLLQDMLEIGRKMQSEIDSLRAQVAAATATSPSVVGVQPLTCNEAAKQIAQIVSRSGGRLTQTQLGAIYGKCPSWYSKVKNG